MSIIDQLKLTQEQRPAELSPEQRLRHKMCEALNKQLAAAIHDAGEGRPYERYEIEEVENPETGEIEQRKVKKQCCAQNSRSSRSGWPTRLIRWIRTRRVR